MYELIKIIRRLGFAMDNNRNIPGQEQDKREAKEYNLYTEKIVKKPGNKIKRAVKHVAKVIGSAVIFGVVAGLVMSVVYPTAKRFIGEEETTTRQGAVIPTDSQTDIWSEDETESSVDETSEQGSSEFAESGTEISSEDISDVSEEVTDMNGEQLVSVIDEQIKLAFENYNPGIEEYDSLYGSVIGVIEEANKSIVSIEVSQDGTTWDYISDAGIRGFIVAEDDKFFYMVTVKELVENKTLSVIMGDGTITSGVYLTGDATTNLAVIAVDKSIYGGNIPDSVKTAALGNSYVLKQGEPLIALGNIYGQGDMAVYTMAASTKNTLMDTDCTYRIIGTDIISGADDTGIIVNTKGEVIAIIPYHNENMSGEIINTYGISELKRLIERLINGKVTPYVGIKPQTVTAAMKEAYGMPDGIYVSSVEADSPAFYAGVQSGDIITSVGTENVSTTRTFQNVLFTMEPGNSAVMYISRPGKDGYRNIEITLELGVEQ